MNIHLLIVDREAWFLSTAKRLMEKQGIHARTAASGPEAMRTLDVNPVDVVVLNVDMPGMGGIEILRKIKEKHSLVEVIMMADDGSAASAVEGLKNGAFDYIVKPCDVPVVIGKIQEARKKKTITEERIRKLKVDRIISHPMAIFENNGEE